MAASVCMCVRLYARMRAWTCLCACVCVHKCVVYACVCVCLFACVGGVCVNVYMGDVC